MIQNNPKVVDRENSIGIENNDVPFYGLGMNSLNLNQTWLEDYLELSEVDIWKPYKAYVRDRNTNDNSFVEV